MKKIIFAVLATLALSGAAQAQSLANVQAVKIVTPYKLTCSSITLSSVTPLELTGNTASVLTSSQIYGIIITPLDSSATNYFSDNPAVSASGDNIGYPVWPVGSGAAHTQPNPARFVISPMQKWYGISSLNGTAVMLCKQK